MTPDDVQSRLHYDPATGHFTTLKASARRRVGDRAGYVKSDGYRLIAIDGKYHYAHRLAWLVHTGKWPAHEIDHINGDRDDNRIENLRAATRSENMMNSQSGKGWHRNGSRWQALIRVNRKRHFLGNFDTESEAQAAYEAAARRLHGDFAFIQRPEQPRQDAMSFD